MYELPRGSSKQNAGKRVWPFFERFLGEGSLTGTARGRTVDMLSHVITRFMLFVEGFAPLCMHMAMENENGPSID